MEPI
jgi:hypothetical protein